uniref:DUF8039 domain-containing protein n=1 Tax=Oryza brachyantha TaxID=4533 RepID=J3N1U1_ORYBR
MARGPCGDMAWHMGRTWTHGRGQEGNVPGCLPKCGLSRENSKVKCAWPGAILGWVTDREVISRVRMNALSNRLGTGGYIGKADSWAEEDEAAHRSGALVPFTDLEVERAWKWSRARAKQNPDNTLMFPNNADADVYRQMQLFVDTAPCVLQVRVMAKFSSDAVEGLVFKPLETIRVHSAQLLDGHAKVQVDRVLDGWITFPLENPQKDEILTLCATKGTYIEWPKHNIIIRIKPMFPPIPQPKDSMPSPVEPNVEASIGQALTDPHFGCGPALEVDDFPPNLPPIKTVVRASSSPSITYQEKILREGNGERAPISQH